MKIQSLHPAKIHSFRTALLCGALALPLSLANGSSAWAIDRQTQPSPFTQRLAAARELYFRDIEGDRSADEQAREQFAALAKERPADSVVQAYIGSLDLLGAARTWVFWNKHVLSQQGLSELDRAVDQDPADLEARFIRAATTLHLPFFFHRREQAESDFAYIAPRAAAAVARGQLPPQLGAAALDYYGQTLSDRNDRTAARSAYQTAVRIDESSPGGRDACKRLKKAD